MNITTYKQVYETADAMRRDGCSEAVVASRRAELIAQVERRYKRQAERARSVSVPGPLRLEQALGRILKVYDLDPRPIFRRNRGRLCVMSARRAFVCAARSMGYSQCEIAVYLRRPGCHSSVSGMERTATPEERAIAAAAVVMDSPRKVKEASAA